MALIKRDFAFHVSAVLLIFFVCFSSCKRNKRYGDSEMYNFSHPTVIKLPEALDEISGITYYPKDTSLFAIVDEDGLLFKIPILHPKDVKQWRFDKKRDYEDVVLIDSTFYVLVSNGDIETVRFVGNNIETKKSDFSTRSKKANEFESIFYNNKAGNLILVCKECEDDTKKTFSMFSYSITDSQNNYDPFQTIDAVPIAKKLGFDKLHIKASAAAINPVTDDLYVLSAVNEIMVVLSRKGELREVYKLDPGLYKQPEGMAFTPQGDLIISNEFAENGFATLLIMKNKLKGR